MDLLLAQFVVSMMPATMATSQRLRAPATLTGSLSWWQEILVGKTGFTAADCFLFAHQSCEELSLQISLYK